LTITQSQVTNLTNDLAAKAPLASPTFTGTVTTPLTAGFVKSSAGGVLSATTIAESDVTNLTTDLAAKAPLAGPTFTGTVTLPDTTSIGSVSATEVGYLDGVTSAIQTQLDTKLASATAATTYAPIANATLTGTVVLPGTTSIGNVSATEIGYLDGVTSAIQTQLDAKQVKISGVSDTEIGYLDGVTSAIQTQLDSKLSTSTASSTYAPLAAPTFTGTVVLPSTTSIGNVSATEIGYVDGVTSAIQTQIDGKQATVTGAATTITGSDLTASRALTSNGAGKVAVSTVTSTELGYVSGVTSAIQTQLDDKSPLASPTFTGTLTSSDLVVNGALKVTQATKEKVYITGTGFAGYTYYFVTNGAIQYITANSTGNGTVNIRPSSSVTTDSFLAVGESVTIVLQITNGTAYYPNVWQIDGTGVTPKWQGGTPPSGGNANSIDTYSVTITKTASATYTVLASQTKFA
jgi:hypothetical protein